MPPASTAVSREKGRVCIQAVAVLFITVLSAWAGAHLTALSPSASSIISASAFADIDSTISKGLSTSAVVEANRPTCRVVCGEGSVQQMELRNTRSLTLVQTRIPGLAPLQQFNLLIHPITVDRFASSELLMQGINHPSTTAIFQRAIALIGAAPLVYDVGANIGYFSLLSASMGAKVVSVEPTPYHRALFTASLALNRLSSQVKVIPHALIEHAGKGPSQVCMEMPDTANAGFTRVAEAEVQSNGSACKEEFIAKTTTLGSIISRHGSPRIIKVDVEGFEMTALRGGMIQLARHPPDLFILEYNSYTFTTVNKLPTLRKRNHQMATELAAYFFDALNKEDAFFLVDLSQAKHKAQPLKGRKHWLQYLLKGSDTKLWNTDLVIIRKGFIQQHGAAALFG